MKKFFLALVFAGLFFSFSDAWAFKSSAFKGSYQVLSAQGPAALDRQFLSFDVDTLEVMWSRYASGSFPANLEDIRFEPTILVRFTNRDISFFTLEANCLVAGNYISIRSDDGGLEMASRADGKFDLVVVEKNVATRYLLNRL